MAEWNEIVLNVPTSEVEEVSAIVTAVTSGGLFIEDYSDMLSIIPTIGHYDYISESLLAKDKSQASIHFYLAEDEEIQPITAFIEERLTDTGIPFNFIFRTVSDIDWEESWKQYFHTRKIGKNLVICPSWEEYTKRENEYVVILDPGMSFGTGDHESTQLALKLLESCSLNDSLLLDIGTGSGILGISALILGAKNVLAVDIDPVSVKISKENATLNSVEDRYEVICGNVMGAEFAATISCNADFITSNVVADFHIANALFYYDRLKPNGKLIVSGIIAVQLEEVQDSMKKVGFGILKTESENGWCAILLEKL